jgi:hypothetical protein
MNKKTAAELPGNTVSLTSAVRREIPAAELLGNTVRSGM